MTNLKHRTWPCVLLWSLTGLWFALIWYFSAQSGAESELLSGGLARRAAAWLLPHADAQSLAALEHLLRKAAHMSEFAVLACLLALSMQASRVPHPVTLPARCPSWPPSWMSAINSSYRGAPGRWEMW